MPYAPTKMEAKGIQYNTSFTMYQIYLYQKGERAFPGDLQTGE
jgi:hypothetical protein